MLAILAHSNSCIRSRWFDWAGREWANGPMPLAQPGTAGSGGGHWAMLSSPNFIWTDTHVGRYMRAPMAVSCWGRMDQFIQSPCRSQLYVHWGLGASVTSLLPRLYIAAGRPQQIMQLGSVVSMDAHAPSFLGCEVSRGPLLGSGGVSHAAERTPSVTHTPPIQSSQSSSSCSSSLSQSFCHSTNYRRRLPGSFTLG